MIEYHDNVESLQIKGKKINFKFSWVHYIIFNLHFEDTHKNVRFSCAPLMVAKHSIVHCALAAFSVLILIICK